MKSVVLIFCISFLFLACDKSQEFTADSNCSVENPIEDLKWLKVEIENQEIEGYTYAYIMKATRNNQVVFIHGNCDPSVNSVAIVYNCDGEELGYIGDNNYPVNLLNDGAIIWQSADHGCSFTTN